MTTKICSSCKKEKDVSEFYKDISKVNGYSSWCKECILISRKQYYENNKEQAKERNREYDRKRYALKNYLRSFGSGYKRSWCSSTLQQHRKKGHTVDITIAELYEKIKFCDTCNICGKQLKWSSGKLADNSPSLDRINNGNIINANNIQIVCHQCNTMKNDELIEWCKTVLMYASK